MKDCVVPKGLSLGLGHSTPGDRAISRLKDMSTQWLIERAAFSMLVFGLEFESTAFSGARKGVSVQLWDLCYNLDSRGLTGISEGHCQLVDLCRPPTP